MFPKGYKEHFAIMRRFFSIKIIENIVKKFGYNEHLLTTSGFFCIFNRSTLDPVYEKLTFGQLQEVLANLLHVSVQRRNMWANHICLITRYGRIMSTLSVLKVL